MPSVIHQLSNETLGVIRDTIRAEVHRQTQRWRSERPFGRNQSHEFWAKTTTDPDLGSVYPGFPANKFVIEFGRLDWNKDSTGDEDALATYETNAARRKVIACSYDGIYVPEDTIVRAYRIDDKWYFSPIERYWIFKMTTNWSGSPPTCTADLYTLDNVDTGASVTVTDQLTEADDMQSGNSGHCIAQNRRFDFVQAPCGTA